MEQDTPAVYAARATRAYAAMQRDFRTRSGLYRRDGRLHLPGTAAHLWPFSGALFATLHLAGVGQELIDFDADAEIAERLKTLERYWDPSGAYSSDVLGTRLGGDRYYDDNAWVGLALVQLERMRPGSGQLDRARELFRFAVSGWDRRHVPSPGGVFWVEQRIGVGAKNHDRNTVSNAPNAELGLHLAELSGAPVATDGESGALREGPISARPDRAIGGQDGEAIGPEEMYEWVLATLDASRETDSPATGLFWDKLRGDGTLDKTLWSYNQGTMVGANVLFARRGGTAQPRYLARAEAIARKALQHYARGGFERQPPAFNAILFRNLLLLHAATRDDQLRTEIINAMRGYAGYAWDERRDRRDRFHLADGGVTLLNQSAIATLLALLAWDPHAYGQLA